MPWQTQGLYSPVLAMNSNFKRQQIKKHKTLQTNYESAGSSQEFFYFHFHRRWLTVIFKHRIHIIWENKNKHQHPLDTPGSVFSALYFLTPEVLLISFKNPFQKLIKLHLKTTKVSCPHCHNWKVILQILSFNWSSNFQCNSNSGEHITNRYFALSLSSSSSSSIFTTQM